MKESRKEIPIRLELSDTREALEHDVSHLLGRFFELRIARGGVAGLQDDHEPLLDALFKALAEDNFMGGPHYAGHMNTLPNWPAVVGGMLADLFGINMLTQEQSGMVRNLEREVVGNLAHLCGLEGGGRLTSSGTISNIEALYLARQARAFVPQTAHLAKSMGLNCPGEAPKAELLEYAEELIHRLRRKVGPEEAMLNLEEAIDQEFPLRRLAVLAGRSAHYSIRKAVRIVGGGSLRFVPVEVDEDFRMDPVDLVEKLADLDRQGIDVLAVVTTAGSTATGSMDPVQGVLDLQARWGFWWHVDAAYGGHFRTALFSPKLARDSGVDAFGMDRVRPTYQSSVKSRLPPSTLGTLEGISGATSLSIDPHKLGFVPKGCGALLLADPRWASFAGETAGYFADDRDCGLQFGFRHTVSSGIEGSRSGRAPMSCYINHRLTPLHRKGLGQVLEGGVQLAQIARQRMPRLSVDGICLHPLHHPDSNILCAIVGRSGETLSQFNQHTSAFVAAVGDDGAQVCSLISFRPSDSKILFEKVLPEIGVVGVEGQELLALRFVFSNPDLGPDWTERFLAIAEKVLIQAQHPKAL